MKCYIYRSSLKQGLYVYLADKDGLDQLPPPVKKQLGKPEFAMELELHPNRKLEQEDIQRVRENLANNGFHIQMPRDIEAQLTEIANSINPTQS